MAAQADGFLVHGNLVGKNGSLRQNPAFVDGSIGQHLFHFVLQPGAVVNDRLAASGLHLGDQAQDGRPTAPQIRLQRLPFRGAHIVEALQSLIDHAEHIRQQLLLVHLGLVHGEHVGHTGQHGHADVVPDAVGLRHLLHGGEIPLHHSLVQGDLHVGSALGTDGQEHVHLAPGNGVFYRLLHRILAKGQAAGQLDGAVQITVVDGAQLHRKFPAVHGFHGAAIAGHTLNQDHYPLFSFLPAGNSRQKP